ncbi:late cornified envelope protein 6A [Equus przewalskii]|uniref:Late cornified envelope protein 6A n=1 Tax=Equus przewalskii TaxID=9798 RepID=A0ABM2EFN8_EQUPR|nr:PREDICTED: late cornified envelope protein 6A [Equus przewalskii]XP_008513621.1 PREDICTED: late cornified envelope protein 6A [Equus przewalskii]XP_014595260.1 late cornified envelope protein 6A [Equus caballus]
MSQQKQQSWEPPGAPQCAAPQCPSPSLASCFAPCCAPHSGSCGSGSRRPRDQSPARSERAHQKPRCLSGGTTYHIKEEEC